MADTQQLIKNALDAYNQEMSAIDSAGLPADRRKEKVERAEKRFVKSLKDANVSSNIIDAYETIIKETANNETRTAELLRQAAYGQVQHIQELQTKQAEMLMSIKAAPERMKASISSLAVGLATIMRFFGANDMADSIEMKADEIMDTIHIGLDTKGIGNGATQMGAAHAYVQQGLANNTAIQTANSIGQRDMGDIQTPASNLPTGSHNQVTTWDKYRQALMEAGLSATDVDKISPLLKKDAALTGKNDVLETGMEITAAVNSKDVQSLGQDKALKTQQVLEKLALELS